MRGITRIVFCFALLAVSPSGWSLTVEPPQPPSLLGVWYGTYEVTRDEARLPAEMWLGIFSQQGKDGWKVSGHSRWNVIEESGEVIQGGDSLGRFAEHFDTVAGTIAKDRKSVAFRQDTQGYRMSATLTGSDAMHGEVFAEDADEALFSVALKRIRTNYTPGESTVKGIDVSHHSGAVDWGKVKAQGYRFAYVKSSEGVDNADPRFKAHWQALAQSGLARGAYHFYVTEDDPIQQAKFFASQIKGDPGELPPAVDVELLGHGTDKAAMSKTLITFLKALESETGIKPMIYTAPRFWDEHYEPAFSGYHLWMAEYGVKMPKTPFGWDNWLLWQHASDRPVDGVEKSADINLLHPKASLDDLTATRSD